MACLTGFLFALLFALATAQMPIQSFFNVPATAFNRGGRVDFSGLSLGQICKQLVLLGGKEALSDGMGMAAKWFSSQRAPSQLAGGTDPQMQCLYSQATGGMIPGTTGTRDPGNMFGDYYDTVIEYPLVVDPCTAPQCNGKVNPTALLMQAFGRFGRPGAGFGGGMPGAGFGGGMPGAGYGGGMPGAALGGSMPGAALGGSMPGGMTNPLASMGQNPLLAALMPNSAPVIPVSAPGNGTSQYLPVTPSPAASAAASAASLPQILQGSPMSSMMQNPQLMQMMQMLQGLMKNSQSPTGLNTNPAFSPFGSLGYPLGSMFL